MGAKVAVLTQPFELAIANGVDEFQRLSGAEHAVLDGLRGLDAMP